MKRKGFRRTWFFAEGGEGLGKSERNWWNDGKREGTVSS